MFSPNNFTEFIDFSELKQNPNPNPYLTIDMLLDVVVKKKFPLLSLGWYLLCAVSGSRCLPRDSDENTLSDTTFGNVYLLPPYNFWILSGFIDFSEIHLGITPILSFLTEQCTKYDFFDIFVTNLRVISRGHSSSIC